ncbi:MAG: hypothetical protein SLAVMIC_00293 [uncultured marine phage]|uniref:Uncharacterized protein n=1 Tax=uncultured marine phage TaxID=707152 RepID=A0A8D9C8P1_9VIRU|nr:MAG: hypothetical protein SLAVMIC_00293 [uncultured marine phage]
MKDKSAHIFDIENTLWSVKRQVWIIDKMSPEIPIIKLDESDFGLIESGIYRNQDNIIRFNGKEYFLPTDLMEQLKVRVKKEKSDIGNLGFSMQEYLDKDIINKLEFDILSENISHVKNKVDDIYVVSSNVVKERYNRMIKKLDEKMEDVGLNVKEYYLISETFNNQNEDENIFKKGITILRHLIGLNIKDSQFINEECDMYNCVNYYDSDNYIISRLSELQAQFEHLYYNSEQSVQELILNRFNESLKFNLNVVTTNELNKFISNEMSLSKPKKLMVFESFKRNNNMKFLKRFSEINESSSNEVSHIVRGLKNPNMIATNAGEGTGEGVVIYNKETFQKELEGRMRFGQLVKIDITGHESSIDDSSDYYKIYFERGEVDNIESIGDENDLRIWLEEYYQYQHHPINLREF